jgi:2-(1,2-epoxy-1,2-dihydrophenyl)acetyl-CoA isomerase
VAVTTESDAAPVILTDVTDRIGTITLNRPERRNALDPELIAALDEAVTSMADDESVKVVILTGAAPEGRLGGFCSGGDTKAGAESRHESGRDPRSEMGVPLDALDGDLARHDAHAAMRLHLMPKPTIAMIGGPAVGAGCSLAAACDFRFAADDAVFASSFSTNGLSGDYGGTFFWTQIIGTARTRELYFLNDKIPAARALELGMVHAVVPAAELREYTLGIARRLLRTSASLLGLVKDNLNEAEYEVDRRRYLFAHEAENQMQSVADRRARAATRPIP